MTLVFSLIFFQEDKLCYLSEYKNQFYISETQIVEESIRPENLATIVRKYINVIPYDREEIIQKTKEFVSIYETLSFFDCLCMAYSLLDGYCLVTDDKALKKKCSIHHIETKSSKEIEQEFIKFKKL